MSDEQRRAMLEAILYLESGGLSLRELSKKLFTSEEETQTYLEGFQKECEAPHRGVELVQHGAVYKLVPKRSFYEYLHPLYGHKARAELSRAAVETLAIVAYSQPITRADIEALRGVSSSAQIRLLLSLDLVKEEGKSTAPGRPALLCTTRSFLEQFGLASLDELPKLDAVDALKFSH